MGKKKNTVDPLEPARRAPDSVTILCLNPGKLGHSNIDYEPTDAFPSEVLACKNLEELDLFRGLQGEATIPDAIGQLTKLVSLGLGGLGMTSLPESIGHLKNLRKLSLAYSEALRSLPDTIGELANLEELELDDTEGLIALPESIGRLTKLKKLSLRDSGIESVPRSLWSLTALEELALPALVHSLPPGIAALTSLKTLWIHAKALGSIANELRELSRLENLHVAQVQDESNVLPEQVGDLPALKWLRAPFAGLSALPKSLARHSSLEHLDVAGNPIRQLEELVVSLPKLVKLDVSSTSADRPQKRRIDAMMKLPASERRLNAPLAPKPRLPKPKRLGSVASVNASLSMLVADLRVAREWGTTEDWDRMCDALSNGDAAELKVGGEQALALTLGMTSGSAKVYRVGDAVVLVEGTLDDWEDASFLEDLATPRDAKAMKVGNVVVETELALLNGTSRIADDDDGLLLVKTAPGAYDVFLEAEKSASWGEARRAWLVKA